MSHPSLFAGMDAIVHDCLQIASTRHRSALDTIATACPAPSTIAAMVERMFAQVSANWDQCRRVTARHPSGENWRWCSPVIGIVERNRSPEVVLERSIVRACVSSGRTDWANQVPVASGIVNSTRHKRSAIDLIHKHDDGAFEFIELKISSDTPLSAAVQLLQYGFIWLLSRRDRKSLGYRDAVLLDASTIHLRVLAPLSYYRNQPLSVLAEGIDTGVKRLGTKEPGTRLTFAFQEFSDALVRSNGYSNEEALAVIEERRTFNGRRLSGAETEERVIDEWLLPGLPAERILAAYAATAGKEIERGKLANPESSAALVANAFGFFLNRPAFLPQLPGGSDWNGPAGSIELEATLRFPWYGGRHPCLDVLITTEHVVIGIESKRYEPFRCKPHVTFSAAYWRPVWGSAMRGYESVRDALRDGTLSYAHVDAVQLVKHAFGLRTAVHKNGRFGGKRPVLLYLFAEPRHWPDGQAIADAERDAHRNEITDFARRVLNDEVAFSYCSYSDLLETWHLSTDPAVRAHAAALAMRYKSEFH